ncbi:alpha/beta fold hydrolase [Streptomyces sp. NPDC051662]|uniref:alpha/beta fold hydrolase n=1 Tax=Streptomyces sp. NPDC051662 TaxID=3154750 RepID=UPI00343C17CD
MTTGTPSDSSFGGPVVLVHGIATNTEALWRRAGWIDAFESVGRTVIGLDLPGHGTETDNPDRDPVDALLELATKYGSIDAVGFSVGAWAVLTAATERPELFHRIALLGAADSVLTGGLHTPVMQAPMVAVLRADEVPADNLMAIAMRAMVADAGNDRDAVATYLETEKRFCTRESLAAVTSPTLLVQGGDDEAGPSTMLAQTIPHTELLSVDHARHFEIPTSEQALTAATAFIGAAS